MISSYRTAYKNMAGSGQVLAGEGWICGYISKVTGASFTLVDGLTGTTTTTPLGVINPTMGETVLLPNIHFSTGCYAIFTGTAGSSQVTFFTLDQ